MSIDQRGNSWRVKIFVKGVLQKPCRSFPSREQAAEWEAIEKARILISRSKTKLANTVACEPSNHMLVRPLVALGDGLAVVTRSRRDDEAPRAARTAELTTPPTGPTVMTLIDRFRKEVTPKKAGCKQEDCRLNQFARLALAKRTVASLRKSDFTDWQKHRIEVDGMSNETVNKERSIWKSLFKVSRDEWKVSWPRDDEGNSFNPADIPALPAGEPRSIRLSDDEEACLLKHAAASNLTWLALAIKMCLEINLRRGELLRMKRCDINWKLREIKLNATIVKNRTARRVPLTSRTIAILREAIATIPADALDRVFPSGDRAFSFQFSQAKQAAAKEMPALANFRLHDTRHESISRMSMKIKSTVVLARATGHLEPRHLLRYVNPTSGELADMME